MAKQKGSCECKDRLGKVGGQAVLEGVMMKAGTRTVTTCRKEDGSIVVYDKRFHSVRNKHKILNIPILRGVINFVEMLMLSFKTLGYSADALDLETGKDKEKKQSGKKTTTDLIMILGMILGIGLAVVLFMLLPGLISDFVKFLVEKISGYEIGHTLRAVIEGVAKILIFIVYLLLVSLMKDIKRTFMYHGAEHKSIACFEAGAPLTPENAKNYTRFHPRCGTSFMFVMIIIGVAVGIALNNIFPTLNRFLLTAIRLLILPLVVGIGYEFIMFAGKHNNVVIRALSAPGLWMQRITTKEPTEDMLEIAIISIKCALRDDYPEFAEFYEARGWEKKEDSEPSMEADLASPSDKTDSENTPTKIKDSEQGSAENTDEAQ